MERTQQIVYNRAGDEIGGWDMEDRRESEDLKLA